MGNFFQRQCRKKQIPIWRKCNGATLSGGEKKKLLMLKWLLNPSTSFVILDEIDAGLDDETKVVLKELEKELLKDRKKIVMKISHIDEDMDGYDQIIRL